MTPKQFLFSTLWRYSTDFLTYSAWLVLILDRAGFVP